MYTPTSALIFPYHQKRRKRRSPPRLSECVQRECRWGAVCLSVCSLLLSKTMVNRARVALALTRPFLNSETGPIRPSQLRLFGRSKTMETAPACAAASTPSPANAPSASALALAPAPLPRTAVQNRRSRGGRLRAPS